MVGFTAIQMLVYDLVSPSLVAVTWSRYLRITRRFAPLALVSQALDASTLPEAVHRRHGVVAELLRQRISIVAEPGSTVLITKV